MAIVSVKRKREIENGARKVFERYLRVAEDLCAGEVGPRDVLPVKTEIIIEKLCGVQLRRERNLPNELGALTAGGYDGSGVLISDDRTVRDRSDRFTQAHEIGHIELHPGETHLRERSVVSPKPLKEQEADYFAANLLMPEELAVHEFTSRFPSRLSAEVIDEDSAFALTSGKLRPSQIRKMSRRQFAELIATSSWFNGHHFDSLMDVFGVSAEAMGRRLIELGLVS
jgi:Zn-dependent peptidase ImmA (M78 family)